MVLDRVLGLTEVKVVALLAVLGAVLNTADKRWCSGWGHFWRGDRLLVPFGLWLSAMGWILGGWPGIGLISSSVMRVRTGRGRSGWPGSWPTPGTRVELDVWDWAAGRNFVTAMSDALERCDRVVALFSAAYFDRSRYTTEEWSAAVVHVPRR